MSHVRKPGIPQVPRPQDPRDRFDVAIKETLEILTGRRGTPIKPLLTTATTAEIAAKINEILDVLQ
jgi:hypothetical protein